MKNKIRVLDALDALILAAEERLEEAIANALWSTAADQGAYLRGLYKAKALIEDKDAA